MSLVQWPIDLPDRYKYQYRVKSRRGQWSHHYEVTGARGAIALNVTGPLTSSDK